MDPGLFRSVFNGKVRAFVGFLPGRRGVVYHKISGLTKSSILGCCFVNFFRVLSKKGVRRADFVNKFKQYRVNIGFMEGNFAVEFT